jgi:peptidoglycan LD-endopeptidase LytH
MGSEVQGRPARGRRITTMRPGGRGLLAWLLGPVLVLAPLASDPVTGSAVRLLPYVPRYPHQAYGLTLVLSALPQSHAARAWLDAADGALEAAVPVALPWRSQTTLEARGAAAAYAFRVPTARKLRIAATPDEASTPLFVDLFAVREGRYERVGGGLPGQATAAFDLELVDEGDYVLRLQPEIEGVGRVAVEIAIEPLLKFPVQGAGPRAMWSGFGAERDGGRRAHRGVDIFAARGTPVLAATDAWVTRVETTRVGGNVVWLAPLFGDVRLYYAHLDEQWVERGDFVGVGQPLGTVGNTGNAATTPPHLHFGVYVRQPGRRGGARDPALFLR